MEGVQRDIIEHHLDVRWALAEILPLNELDTVMSHSPVFLQLPEHDCEVTV